jgi:molybdate transport system substrate-binding protein
MATLVNMGLIPELNSKMVEGANITKAFQFVDSGNAELGFVAWSQVVEGGSIKVGSGWLVPASMHAPIRQAATLLVPGVDNPAARALLQYLQGDRARAVIRAAGYEL